MDRRRFVLSSIAAAAAPVARGQAAGKVFQIGLMANSVPASEIAARKIRNPAPKIIEDGLRDLGWIDGKNIRLIWKTVEGKYERWPEVIREFVRLRVDVIVVFADGAAKAAIDVTRTIPVVHAGMGALLDPKIIDSLPRPGGNLTGVSIDGLNLGAKRLELLKAAAPSVNRVAVLLHRSGPPIEGNFLSEQTRAVARNLKVDMFPVSFENVEGIPGAFTELVSKRANGILVGETPYMYYREYQVPIHEQARKHRIPAMYRILNSVESGGLMAYAPDILEIYRAAPRYINKILRGAKPGDLPVEVASKFEFVINLTAAKAIGLAIPSFVLALADRVIE